MLILGIGVPIVGFLRLISWIAERRQKPWSQWIATISQEVTTEVPVVKPLGDTALCEDASVIDRPRPLCHNVQDDLIRRQDKLYIDRMKPLSVDVDLKVWNRYSNYIWTSKTLNFKEEIDILFIRLHNSLAN